MVPIVLVIGLCNLALGVALAFMLERPRVITLPVVCRWRRHGRHAQGVESAPAAPAAPIAPVQEAELDAEPIPETWLDTLADDDRGTATQIEGPLKAICVEIRDYRNTLCLAEQAMHDAVAAGTSEQCTAQLTTLKQHTNRWLRHIQNAVEAVRDYAPTPRCECAIADLRRALQQQTTDGPTLSDGILTRWEQSQGPAAINALCELTMTVHELRDTVLETLVMLMCEAGRLEQFERRQHFDVLTHLYNRLGTEILFSNWRRAVTGSERPLCVALLDLDAFAALNRSQTTRTGDAVLGAVGRLFESMVLDSNGAYQVGRVSGQQFLVFFADTELADAVSMTDNLCQTLAAAKFSVGAEEVRLSMTAVVTAVRAQMETTSLLLALREELADAKRAGRGRVFAESEDGFTMVPPGEWSHAGVVVPALV